MLRPASHGRFGSADANLQYLADTSGHLVLDLDKVAFVSIIGIGPYVVAVLRADQLRCYAHPTGGPPHASFQNIGNAKFLANLLYVLIVIPELKRGCARRYP